MRLGVFVALVAIFQLAGQTLGENVKTVLRERPRWIESRVVGSPEPLPPYTVEPVFTQIAWKNRQVQKTNATRVGSFSAAFFESRTTQSMNSQLAAPNRTNCRDLAVAFEFGTCHPVFAIREPGSEGLVFAEWPQPIAAESNSQGDDKKLPPRFAPDRAVCVLDRAGGQPSEPFLELKDRAIYCLAFHPHYRENGQVFVCSKTHPEGGGINYLSRFAVSHRKEDDRDSKLVCDPETQLSAMAGRQLPLFSLIIPAWMVCTMSGWKGMRGAWPAVIVCGGTFAAVQFLVSNYLGPSLTDVLGGVASMLALTALLRVWRPSEVWHFAAEHVDESARIISRLGIHKYSRRETVRAWVPWVILSACVFL